MKLLKNAVFYKKEISSILVNNEKIIDYDVNSANIEEIDLGGCFIYPGFTDTHTHSFEGGLYQMGVNLNNIKNMDELLAKISEAQIISGCIFAFSFDENLISEKRFPTIHELDKISSAYPILLRRIDGHSCIINSIAYKKIGIKKTQSEVLRGELNDIVAHWFHRNLDNESIIQAYKTAEKKAIQGGFTTIHTMIGDANQDPLHYELMRDNLSNFDIDFVLYPQILNVSKALDLGAKRIGGCILADGSFGSFTAAISEPYKNIKTKGKLYQTDNFWKEFVLEAHKNNLQVGVHCIGDVAINQLLSAYENAQNLIQKDLRHQIIHNELNTDFMIEKLKRTNSSAVMQPMFDYLWGTKNGLYEKVLGVERTKFTSRFKSIYDAGVLITGGSDWYITELDIRKQINAAININNPSERLSFDEAMKIYTSNAAKLSFDENTKGSMDIGKNADFVGFEKDLSKFPNNANKIMFVIKNGKIIYQG